MEAAGVSETDGCGVPKVVEGRSGFKTFETKERRRWRRWLVVGERSRDEEIEGRRESHTSWRLGRGAPADQVFRQGVWFLLGWPVNKWMQ